MNRSRVPTTKSRAPMKSLRVCLNRFQELGAMPYTNLRLDRPPAVGGMYRGHLRLRFAILSWRRDDDWRPMGAAAHFHAILAIKNPTVFCTARFIPCSSDRGGSSAAASGTAVPHWTAGRCYGYPGGSRPDTVAAKADGRYRKSRASDGTA